MENFPKKKRGRPRKIPEPEFRPEPKFRQIPKELRQRVGLDIPTERTTANRFYASMARETVEALSKQVLDSMPHDPVRAAKVRVGMDWILARTTILTELGRMMDEDPAEQAVARFHHVLEHVAARHDKLTAKAAVAYIRRQRMGETKRRDRVAALHRDLNAAINLHRKRFPESSWDDVRKALEHTVSQVSRKA